ncbi:MAG TPA: hypothetical protein VFX98_10950 [Longimicrobiaceae bacterium]|nr:hypothetical protein [Longimicrobiaceae bacterium]
MRIIRFICFPALLLCAQAVLTACDGDPSGPEGVPSDELVFLRAAEDAPALLTDSVSFWAVAGDTREIRIPYAADGPYAGDECLRFKIPGNGLLRHPDGRPVERGDSVFITIRVVDPALFSFEFSPAGLQFDPDHPAELRVSFKWADRDYDGDGNEGDDDDERIERTFGMWRQETPASDWERIGTVRDFDLEEARADLEGFTKYALAGGRSARTDGESSF